MAIAFSVELLSKPEFLEVTLQMIKSEALDAHHSHYRLGCGFVGAAQLCDCLHEPLMKLRRPPQARLRVCGAHSAMLEKLAPYIEGLS
jgi:hypothetical protein